MEKGYIGITDNKWFEFINKSKLSRVNFWCKKQTFKVLKRGDVFFFLKKNAKHEKGERKIVGYGIFDSFRTLTVSKAWDEFKEANGCASLKEFQQKISDMYDVNDENVRIGCIILNNITIFSNCICLSSVGIEFANSIVSGKAISEQQIKKLLATQEDNIYISEKEEQYGINTLENIKQELSDGIKKSKGLSQEERDERLSKANKKPKEVNVTVKVFKRNPDVVVAVLERANGICERCGAPAPFMRASDATPYLEVHHKVRLADGGEDTVENAIAVCPNCHRELHFGIDGRK